MRKLRVALYALLALMVLGGLGVGAVFYLSQGAVSAADDFFSILAKAGPDAAYAKASPAFREAQTDSSFSAWAAQRGLNHYQSASWNSRSLSGGKAELSGTLRLQNGSSIPAKVTLTKNETGAWQVVFLDIEPAGVAAQPGRPALPELVALNEPAMTTMSSFGAAVNANDFNSFYTRSSRLWQSQTTAAKLRDTFALFVDRKVNLTAAAMSTPAFLAPPALDANGVLTLKGYFPAGKQPWYFEFEYIYEYPI
jgi:hypothetical protein